jgi:uncharacterized protein YdaU (DUF1376 family)
MRIIHNRPADATSPSKVVEFTGASNMSAAASRPVERLAWMPWYVSDYIARTRHLTLAQRGALADMFAIAWTSGPLPADVNRIAAMVGAAPAEFRKIWPGISGWWTETEDHHLVNVELEGRRLEAIRTYQARAESGRNSARNRRKNGVQINGHDVGDRP